MNDERNTFGFGRNDNDVNGQDTSASGSSDVPGNLFEQEKPVYYSEVIREDTYRIKRRKHRKLRIIAAILAVVFIAGSAGVISLFYEIVPGEGKTLFSIARRDLDVNKEIQEFLQLPGNDGDGVKERPSEQSDRTGVADGPTMEIKSPPAEPSPSGIASEKGRELTIPEIAEKVLPSTVGVVATVGSLYGTRNYSGTGIIMSEDGYIITNNHVIAGAEVITITLMDGRIFDAKLIGGDSKSDLAVVKIAATGLKPAEFGDSDALRVGDLAVAIGNPLGLELMGTVTDGIISAINRDVVFEERTMTLIQTNAAINAGNSGGPLINKYGQVIGINTLKMQDYYTNVEGLGFAIPTNFAKEIIDQLIAYGYVKGRPAIGIVGYTLDEYRAKRYNYPIGFVVTYVSPYCDAYAKGLKVYDIIVKAQGKEIKSYEDINRIKEDYVAGDEFTFTVYRSGKYLDITFKIMDEAELERMEDANPLAP
jgi:serine protease Do